MSTGGAILLVGAAAVGVYFFTRSRTNAGALVATPVATGATPPPQVLSSGGAPGLRPIEQSIPGYGGLASATGSLAQKAPTWLKIAVLPVGVTAVAQDLIDHPGATLKSAATTVGNVATSAASSVGHAASSAFHAVTSFL